MLPILETTTITITRSDVKGVRCEQCDCLYFYQLTIQTQAEDTSIAYIGRGGAANTAKRLAMAKVERRFQKKDDPIPCPECGHLQKNMLRQLVERHASQKRTNAGASIGCGFAVLLFGAPIAVAGKFAPEFLAVSSVFAILSLALVAFGISSWRRYRAILSMKARDPYFRTELAEGRKRSVLAADLLPVLCPRWLTVRQRFRELKRLDRDKNKTLSEEWDDIQAQKKHLEAVFDQIEDVMPSEVVEQYLLKAKEEFRKSAEPKPWARPSDEP